jgi:hypothetical protein
MLALDPVVTTWERLPVPGGTELGEVAPLFTKLEPDVLDD